jgi:ABC-2 type transport system permease protein
MNGTMALTRAEISRFRNNRRYLIFTIGLPVMFYLIFAKEKDTTNGVSFAAFYMVGMATFGALSSALNNNAMRISQEKKDGWIRQLRLTPLPANGYVIAKINSSMVTTIPSIVLVFILGATYGNVSMPIWKWIAAALVIWVGTLTFAALAVAIAYKLSPDSVQPVVMLIFFFFSIFGGLWFGLSGALHTFGEFTPTYQIVNISTQLVAAGTAPWANIVGLVAWLAIFITLATLAVRSSTEDI